MSIYKSCLRVCDSMRDIRWAGDISADAKRANKAVDALDDDDSPAKIGATIAKWQAAWMACSTGKVDAP